MTLSRYASAVLPSNKGLSTQFIVDTLEGSRETSRFGAAEGACDVAPLSLACAAQNACSGVNDYIEDAIFTSTARRDQKLKKATERVDACRASLERLDVNADEFLGTLDRRVEDDPNSGMPAPHASSTELCIRMNRLLQPMKADRESLAPLFDAIRALDRVSSGKVEQLRGTYCSEGNCVLPSADGSTKSCSVSPEFYNIVESHQRATDTANIPVAVWVCLSLIVASTVVMASLLMVLYVKTRRKDR